MATTVESISVPKPLEYLPVGFFGATMGITGLSVAWRLAHAQFGTPLWLADAIGGVAALAFVVLLVAYGIKLIGSPQKVLGEFRHPIAGNLFGTLLISLLLLPIVIAPVNLAGARILWCAGAVGMLVFAWLIVSRWMSDRQQTAHATPAWIVPVVGLLDIPLAIPSLQLAPLPGVMLASLAIGLFFSIPVFTLIMARLVFDAPMPDALLPSLLILVAPFSVGFSAYVVTFGRVDALASALYYLMLFALAVLVGRLRTMRSCCPFRVAWWAVSFPFAASAIAALRFSAFEPNAFTIGVAVLLLAVATVSIAGLLVRTLAGVVNGELRTLSG